VFEWVFTAADSRLDIFLLNKNKCMNLKHAF
jgi:hypothetical protein